MFSKNFWKNVVLFSLILLVLLMATGRSVVAYNGENPYVIKKHSSEADVMRSAILIYSIPEKDSAVLKGYLQDINNLVKILESHWNVNIQVKDYKEARNMNLNNYSYYILIELNREKEAIDYFFKITEKPDIKTIWIGWGVGQIFSENINHESISHITYKDVDFDIDKSFAVFGSLPKEQEKFQTLATYTKKDGTVLPLISIYNERNILMPFSLPNYYEIYSYTLPFLDTFHYLLGHHENEKNYALVRLEDVNAHTYRNPRKLIRAYQYLKKENIPFHIALIARYLNPKEGIDLDVSSSKKFLNTLKQIIYHEHGYLVQHGYTHQTGDGVSGIDYEFWNPETEEPLAEDSVEFVQQRILEARKLMVQSGLIEPDIWETPHYAQSDIDDGIFNDNYPIRYEHIAHIGSLPFAISVDKTIFMPENLGFIESGIDELEDKKALLEQLNTFEDPIASFFWHPWRDIRELKMYTTLVEDYGFEFVSVYDLLEKVEEVSVIHPVTGITKGIDFGDITLYFLFFSFIGGSIIYIRNVMKVRKHLNMINKYDLSLEQLEDFAKLKNVPLPKLGIFIPARNEGLVIANTLKRISKIDYPKDRFKVYIIVDERELEDKVERITKEVAQETLQKLHLEYNQKFIKVIEVPKWYSGVFQDNTKSYARSTKGRALNYCLQKIEKDNIDMIGILDADGRLHPNVLKEVAMKRLQWNSKVLQGPVFQVNNFKNVSIIGVAAGLELALHHLTELPTRLMKKNALQFLAGTNYFIDRMSIIKAGGWNQNALVEDAELALRLYLLDGTVGEWLNSPELEQTPANFSIYRRQRERWVRGHLDLLSQVHRSSLSCSSKFYFYSKIFISQFRFLFDVGLPILSIYFMYVGAFIYLSPFFGFLSIILFIMSFLIWDTYGFIYRSLSNYIDPNLKLRDNLLQSIKLFLFIPIFIIVQAIPRIEAIFNSIFRSSNQMWYKTERTAEIAMEA